MGGEQHAEHVVHHVLIGQPPSFLVFETRELAKHVAAPTVPTLRDITEQPRAQSIPRPQCALVAAARKPDSAGHHPIEHSRCVSIHGLVVGCGRVAREYLKANVQGEPLGKPIRIQAGVDIDHRGADHGLHDVEIAVECRRFEQTGQQPSVHPMVLEVTQQQVATEEVQHDFPSPMAGEIVVWVEQHRSIRLRAQQHNDATIEQEPDRETVAVVRAHPK